MNFLENNKIRCPVESLTAAISVKSRLTKPELFNALSNLASIPQCHEPAIQLGFLTKPVSEYILSWPSCFIFAFDGVNCLTCVEHMNEFYASYPTAFNRIPRAIIVNKKYIVTFIHYNVPGASPTTKFNVKNISVGGCDDDSGGYPIFWLMAELAKGVTWLSNMCLDYTAYYNEAYQPKPPPL